MIRIFPRRIGKAFLRSQEANISILLSISAVPLIAAAGMAVDYGRWVTAKTELQAASDAAALAAANAYGQGNQNYAAVADDVLQENISNSGVLQTSVATQTAIDSPANTLTVNATASIPAAFMRVLGINELPLGGADLASALSGETAPTVSSSVVLPVFSDHHKGEIILVMDYSSSMTEYVGGVRKYITMRGEAKKLVEGLSQNGNNGDVKFGLVPFSHAVRVTMPRNFYRGQTQLGHHDSLYRRPQLSLQHAVHDSSHHIEESREQIFRNELQLFFGLQSQCQGTVGRSRRHARSDQQHAALRQHPYRARHGDRMASAHLQRTL
jgi:Flp pilus assembly protein TadG